MASSTPVSSNLYLEIKLSSDYTGLTWISAAPAWQIVGSSIFIGDISGSLAINKDYTTIYFKATNPVWGGTLN